MRGFLRTVFLVFLYLIALPLLVVPVSRAQPPPPWGYVLAETSCSGTTVDIQVDMNIVAEVPEHLVGWVVVRSVVGACVPKVQVGGVHPFEAGQTSYSIHDHPEIQDRKTIYRVVAVNAEGASYSIPWPQRQQWAEAGCVGGPAARGTVIEPWPGYFHLEVCPDSCWRLMSETDEHLPAQAASLVGSIIDIFGELYNGMEGTGIHVTGWRYAAEGCAAIVPADDSSWSVLKARYSGQ